MTEPTITSRPYSAAAAAILRAYLYSEPFASAQGVERSPGSGEFPVNYYK